MKIEINLDKFPKLIYKTNEELFELINYLMLIGYNNVYLNEQNNLSDQICTKIKSQLDLNYKLDLLDENINKLFGLSKTSNKKGEISENIIYDIIKYKFKDYCYEKKRHIPHNADGELNSSSGLKTLVEIKNYDSNVNNNEIIKFKNDLSFNNIYYGLFISIKSGIIGKKYFDYENYIDNDKEFHIIYITNIYENENLFNCAIILLEKIYKINNKKNIKTLKFKNLSKNLDDLNNIIKITKNLYEQYVIMDNNIKSSLNDYLINIKKYDLEINMKIKDILENIEEDIDYKHLNNEDDKIKILSNYKDNKNFIIINKLFDVLIKYEIKIDKDIWNITINNKVIGYAKLLKDKINLELNNTIKIILNKKNLDENLNIIKKIL